MVRVIAWILLLVGVGLAAAGGARNGPAHTADRAAGGVAATLSQAAEGVREAEAALDVARTAGDPAAVDEAEAEVAAARGIVDQLRQAGTFEGDLDTAVAEATARAEALSVPPPGQRFWDWLRVGGPLFGVGTVMVAAGAFLERRARARASSEAAPGSEGAVDFPGAIDHALAECEALASELADLPMDAPSATIRERLDALQDDVLTPVVEGRGQLVARHGTTTFAVYFGAFSGAERNLARTWSALTDGHTPTARDSLQAAMAALREARAAWDAAEAQG